MPSLTGRRSVYTIYAPMGIYRANKVCGGLLNIICVSKGEIGINMVLLPACQTERARTMRNAIENWVVELDSLFNIFKVTRDEAIRQKILLIALNHYTLSYVARRRSDWPRVWQEDVEVRLGNRLAAALEDPSLVQSSISGYMSNWYRSLASSTGNRMDKFVAGDAPLKDEKGKAQDETLLDIQPNPCASPVEECENNARKELAGRIFCYARKHMGIRGRILCLYLLNKMGKQTFAECDIARHFNIPENTIASHIRRGRQHLVKIFAHEAFDLGINIRM